MNIDIKKINSFILFPRSERSGLAAKRACLEQRSVGLTCRSSGIVDQLTTDASEPCERGQNMTKCYNRHTLDGQTRPRREEQAAHPGRRLYRSSDSGFGQFGLKTWLLLSMVRTPPELRVRTAAVSWCSTAVGSWTVSQHN